LCWLKDRGPADLCKQADHSCYCLEKNSVDKKLRPGGVPTDFTRSHFFFKSKCLPPRRKVYLLKNSGRLTNAMAFEQHSTSEQLYANGYSAVCFNFNPYTYSAS
jgi:hypothetical protein